MPGQIPAWRRSPAIHAAVATTLLLSAGVACGGPVATAVGTPDATAATTAATPFGSVPASVPVSAAPSAPRTAPSGFPVMPGSVAVEPLPTEPGLIARWTTDAGGPAVYDFFVEALPAAGFPVLQLAPGGAAAVVRFTGPGGEPLDLALTGDGSGTRISLHLPDEE